MLKVSKEGARRAAPRHSDDDEQLGFDLRESRAMGRGDGAARESAGGQEDGARRAAPCHSEGDGQLGFDVSESRAMG